MNPVGRAAIKANHIKVIMADQLIDWNGPGLMLTHQVAPGPNHYRGVADVR